MYPTLTQALQEVQQENPTRRLYTNWCLGKKKVKLVSEARRAELEFGSLFILFSLLSLHLMQFGSLQSHKYILTLCFKFIYFTDKRLMFYERSMSHSLYFQLSPNSTCAKSNPFSVFFSCKDLAICILSQRQAT